MQNALKVLSAPKKRMSSMEISNVTGKRHGDVLESIRKVLSDAEIDSTEFSAEYKDSTGKSNPYFDLPRFECDLVVSGYSVKYRAAIIKRWHELEELEIREINQQKLPATYIEALEALVVSEKSNQASLVIIDNKDKLLIASNEASIKAGEVMVREFVKSNDLIDIGQNHFYDWLKEQNIIMEHREPYQKYVNLGYLRWKPSLEEHGGKIRHQLMITPRGKVWLAAKYMAWLDRDMAA